MVTTFSREALFFFSFSVFLPLRAIACPLSPFTPRRQVRVPFRASRILTQQTFLALCWAVYSFRFFRRTSHLFFFFLPPPRSRPNPLPAQLSLDFRFIRLPHEALLYGRRDLSSPVERCDLSLHSRGCRTGIFCPGFRVPPPPRSRAVLFVLEKSSLAFLSGCSTSVFRAKPFPLLASTLKFAPPPIAPTSYQFVFALWFCW